MRHIAQNAADSIRVWRARITTMTRRDWLLVFCAYEGAPAGLDPVRIQKGMFLFARSADVPPRERYEFRPYDYGPMSAGIYADLDDLVAEGFVEQRAVAGKHWSTYTATPQGRKRAHDRLRALRTEPEKGRARHLYEIKQSVAAVSFNELLERVYREHPDMAVKSVFQRLH